MTQNKYAKEMMQYAKDAMKTDKPWEKWQARFREGCWHDCVTHPVWTDEYEYRCKPEMMSATCADGTVVTWEQPVTKQLKYGDTYYSANWYFDNQREWNDSIGDEKYLSEGLIHLAKEAAKQHYEALQAINHGSANWKDKEPKVTPDTENEKTFCDQPQLIFSDEEVMAYSNEAYVGELSLWLSRENTKLLCLSVERESGEGATVFINRKNAIATREYLNQALGEEQSNE